MSVVSNYFSARETLPEDEPPLCIAVRRPESLPRHYETGFHHKLTKQELKYVFGVDEHHQVPKYQVINTRRVRKEEGGLQIRFSAWDDDFVLDLKPYRLVSPHIVRNFT
ncbi:hypothetical protein RB195_024384 [Necator americanus]|uniref:Uncharacterized protein n=1 Tax=Necator americanus TaxID=51031 RepID=A0ABR1EN22_NECAM